MTAKNESGAYLRSARESLGLSRAEIAERIGCSTSTVARWERAGVTGRMLLTTIYLICREYHVDPDRLAVLAGVGA